MGALADDTFKAIDRNGDGLASLEEMLHLVNKMEDPQSVELIKKAFPFFDSDGDGKLEFEEWQRLSIARLN